MFQYHCLNPIAEKGLGLFDEDYKKTEELEGTDAILVRSAKMHVGFSKHARVKTVVLKQQCKYVNIKGR